MIETNEKWLQGYEGVYSITTQGEVIKTLPSGLKMRLKNYRDAEGYVIIELSDKWGAKDRYYVHKLVAKTFLENPKGFVRASFKDGNKENIALENLEWEAEKTTTLPEGYEWVDDFEGKYYMKGLDVFNCRGKKLKGYDMGNRIKYNLRKKDYYDSIYLWK